MPPGTCMTIYSWGTRVPTRLKTLDAPGYIRPYTFPGTYPTRLSEIPEYTRRYLVPVYFRDPRNLIDHILYRYPGTYPNVYSKGTRVHTRLYTMGVPGYMPDNMLWGYPSTKPIVDSGVPGYISDYILWGVPEYIPENTL